MRDMRDNAMSCTRHYFITEWYSRFIRAAGRLPGPWTEDPVPTWDAELDKRVEANRKKKL